MFWPITEFFKTCNRVFLLLYLPVGIIHSKYSIPPVLMYIYSRSQLLSADVLCSHVFVQEGSDSRQVGVEAVPHHHLQPADLNLSVQTVKQRRVPSRQTHHHIWHTDRQEVSSRFHIKFITQIVFFFYSTNSSSSIHSQTFKNTLFPDQVASCHLSLDWETETCNMGNKLKIFCLGQQTSLRKPPEECKVFFKHSNIFNMRRKSSSTTAVVVLIIPEAAAVNRVI